MSVPDEVATRVAVGDAERVIARARVEASSFFGLDAQAEHLQRMIAFSVMDGDDLAFVRGWAIRAALVRDAQPTRGERVAWRDALTEVAS